MEIALQSTDNRTWTPAERLYVPSFPTTYTNQRLCVCRDVSLTPEMRVAIQVKSGHLIWAKYRQMSKVIDVEELLNDYWGSTKHEFTVPSQSRSPTGSHIYIL